MGTCSSCSHHELTQAFTEEPAAFTMSILSRCLTLGSEPCPGIWPLPSPPMSSNAPFMHGRLLWMVASWKAYAIVFQTNGGHRGICEYPCSIWTPLPHVSARVNVQPSNS